MTRRTAAQKKLDALVDLFAPKIRDAFLAAIQDVVDNAILRSVIEAIESGDVEAAFRALGFSEAAMRPLTVVIEQAYETGGVMTGQTFPKFLNTTNGKAVFRFDVRNSRAERFLRDQSSELVTRITDETRINVRNVLTRGMQDGRNPRNVALDIVGRIGTDGKRSGGIVGLDNRMEHWVANTRRDLVDLSPNYFNRKLRDKRFDGIVAKAIQDDKALSPDTITKLVDRYKDNALKLRGENIGRTEALQSLNASEYEATKQAIDMGAARPQDVRRDWDSAGDARVRDSHAKMDGQTRGLNEPFVSPSGARLLHPGDRSLGARGDEIINCRCRVRSRIDWIAAAMA